MRYFNAALGAVFMLLMACQSAPKPTPVETVVELEQPEESTVSEVSPYYQHAKKVPESLQQAFVDTLVLQQQQAFEEALVNWQSLAKRFPSFSGIWLNKGLVEKQLQSLQDAEQSFEQAIQVNSYNQEAYNELAILKREQGDFKAAQSLYQQSIAIWPKHARSHKNLAILYDLYLREYALAMQHYALYAQYGELEPPQQKQLKGWMFDLERRMTVAEGRQ